MAQPLNATFFAFRKREKGGVLLGASLAYGVLAILLFGGFIALNLASLGGLASWYMQLITAMAQGDSAAAISGMPPLPAGVGLFFLTLLPVMFLGYLLLAAYEAACLRWMIRGETGGLMGLTLGADTWRVYSTYWVWFFLNIAFSIVMEIIAASVTFGIVMATQGDTTVSIAAVLVFTLLRYALTIWLGVRLAPASAVSVGRRKFSFFTAWTVTRGRFWAMFGAFFLIILIACVLWAIVFSVALGAVFGPALAAYGASGGDPSQAMSALSSALTPQALMTLGAVYLLLIPLSLVFYVMFYGVNARAVLAAAEESRIDGVATADTFA